MSYRIVVGLPSWNDNETIAKVVRDLDAALAMLPFEHDAVILNADNCSDDGTPTTFMSTATQYRKCVLTTPPRGGKGANWRAILEFAKSERADAVLFVEGAFFLEGPVDDWPGQGQYGSEIGRRGPD